MPSVFDNLASAACKDFFSSFAVTVTYQQGAGEPEEIDAIPTNTVIEQPNADGIFIKTEIREYALKSADLGLIPTAGDLIVETVGGVPATYEVAPPPGGKACYHYADEQNQVLRVFTKKRSASGS